MFQVIRVVVLIPNYGTTVVIADEVDQCGSSSSLCVCGVA